MIDTAIVVAVVTAVVGVVTICLQKLKIRFNHHPEGTYDLIIGFDRGTSSERSDTSRTI